MDATETVTINGTTYEIDSHEGLTEAVAALDAAGVAHTPILRDGQATPLRLYATPVAVSTSEVARAA